MGSHQPGVIVSEGVITSSDVEIKSAVPLFIGYTATGAAYTLCPIGSLAEYEKRFGGPMLENDDADQTSILYFAIRHYFDNGGAGGFALSLGGYDKAAQNSSEQTLADFKDPRITTAVAGQTRITLISIPDMVLLPDWEVARWQEAWQTLLNICQCRNGLFGLLEMPDDPNNAISCLTSFDGTGREWGAAYWPRLVSTYSQAGKPVLIPPSAALAAVIESIDAALGVWTAPANVELSKVIMPSQSYLWVNDRLDYGGASFNLIRSFPGRGTRVWGCRTLTKDGNSSQRYIQVRRLLSYIESNVSELARMFVFEPNSEITWYKVKGQVTNWLHKLWLQGGLFGDEEDQAYSVKVGVNESMSVDDVLQGKMIMNIRLSTMYPAEFIELSLTFEMPAGTAL